MKTIFNDPVLYESAIKKVGEAYEKNKTCINLDLGEIHYKMYLNTLRNETGFGLYDTWVLLSKYLKEQYKLNECNTEESIPGGDSQSNQ